MAVVLALVVAVVWNEHTSYVHWELAEQVRRAGLRDRFLGEMGGRAPSAIRRIRGSYGGTIAVLWAIFLVALVGLVGERIARREAVIDEKPWGVLVTGGFVLALTLIWLAVTFT